MAHGSTTPDQPGATAPGATAPVAARRFKGSSPHWPWWLDERGGEQERSALRVAVRWRPTRLSSTEGLEPPRHWETGRPRPRAMCASRRRWAVARQVASPIPHLDAIVDRLGGIGMVPIVLALGLDRRDPAVRAAVANDERILPGCRLLPGRWGSGGPDLRGRNRRRCRPVEDRLAEAPSPALRVGRTDLGAQRSWPRSSGWRRRPLPPTNASRPRRRGAPLAELRHGRGPHDPREGLRREQPALLAASRHEDPHVRGAAWGRVPDASRISASASAGPRPSDQDLGLRTVRTAHAA